MKSKTDWKLEEFVNTLRDLEQQLPGGGVGFNAEALHGAIRDNKDGSAEFVRKQCELAAADPSCLQFAVMLALAWAREFKDENLVNFVVSRGEQLEGLYGEPQERVAAREWWASPQQQERRQGRCDACPATLKPGEGYLLDGRYELVAGSTMGFGVELLCAKCFWRLRYNPRDPNWRDRDDCCFLE